MRKEAKLEVIDFIFISILGTLLHFVYDWFGKNDIIGIFSAINESVWEHLKLLFYPTIIFAIFEKKYIKSNKDFYCIKTKALLKGLAFTVVTYYTITGIIGKNIDFINIVIFFIATFIICKSSYKELIKTYNDRDNICDKICRYSKCILFVIFLLFLVFTFVQLSIGLFIEPKS